MLKRKNEEDTALNAHDRNATKRAALDVDLSPETTSSPSLDEPMNWSEHSLGTPNSINTNRDMAGLSKRNEALIMELQRLESMAGGMEDTYIHIRMLCQVKEAGLIVGKGGEKINHIKKLTDTKINVSENITGVTERVVHFRGKAIDVSRALSLVVKLLTGEDEAKEFSDLESRPAMITLLIPHPAIGFVIGKKGTQLKEIERLSSAFLKASSDSLPFSTDRSLTITGVFDAIHVALLHTVLVLLRTKDQVKGKIVFYQPGNSVSFGPVIGQYPAFPQQPLHSQFDKNGNIRFQIPPPPPPPQQQQQNQQPALMYYSNPPVPVPGHPFTNYQQFIPSMTKFQFDPTAHTHIPLNPPQFTHLPQLLPQFTPLSLPQHQQHQQQQQQQQPVQLHPLIRLGSSRHNEQDIYIPESYIGYIIGKNGRYIKILNESSGCAVVIAPESEKSTNGERKISLIGGGGAGRQTVFFLISEKIESVRRTNERNNGDSEKHYTTGNDSVNHQEKDQDQDSNGKNEEKSDEEVDDN